MGVWKVRELNLLKSGQNRDKCKFAFSIFFQRYEICGGQFRQFGSDGPRACAVREDEISHPTDIAECSVSF